MKVFHKTIYWTGSQHGITSQLKTDNLSKDSVTIKTPDFVGLKNLSYQNCTTAYTGLVIAWVNKGHVPQRVTRLELKSLLLVYIFPTIWDWRQDNTTQHILLMPHVQHHHIPFNGEDKSPGKTINRFFGLIILPCITHQNFQTVQRNQEKRMRTQDFMTTINRWLTLIK